MAGVLFFLLFILYAMRGDRQSKKFRYYQSCPSIQEYVLISAQEQAVDVYRRVSDNFWTLHQFGPDDEVELKSIKGSIPLQEPMWLTAFWEVVSAFIRQMKG